MGLIARVTSNGKASNCTRRSRVLLTLPVLVMSAINPLLHSLIVNPVSCSIYLNVLFIQAPVQLMVSGCDAVQWENLASIIFAN